MKLFNFADSSKNILPYEGTVNYYGAILDHQAGLYYHKLLHEINWQYDQAIIFGKKITTKRMVAWYADQAYEYTYSGIQKIALPWNQTLLTLKEIVEKESQQTYNSCLLNLYPSGQQGMAWHSDAEKDLKKDGAIASLSFGAERKFSFKHKTSMHKVDILLEDGSLLVMKDNTQTNWLHRLPPTKTIHQPRINLTFRTIA